LGTITPHESPNSLSKETSKTKVLYEHPLLKNCTLATLTAETLMTYVNHRKKVVTPTPLTYGDDVIAIDPFRQL
jgi:hypothetical protein